MEKQEKINTIESFLEFKEQKEYIEKLNQMSISELKTELEKTIKE